MVVDTSCILNGCGRGVLSSDCSSPPGDRHAEQRLLRTARLFAWFDRPMTPRQIGLVTETLGSLDLDVLAADFYRRVFDTSPHLAPMFTTDPALQRSRFVTELSALVGSIQDLDRFCSSAEALGARHRGYGARASPLPADGYGVDGVTRRGARRRLDRRRALRAHVVRHLRPVVHRAPVERRLRRLLGSIVAV